MVTLVMVPPQDEETAGWPERLEAEVAGLRVVRPGSRQEAREQLAGAEAAFGEVGPELFAVAERLRWVQAPVAGPAPGFFHRGLVESDVVVTNMRDTYTDHVSAHAMALVLALARGLPKYVRDQDAGRWAPERGDAAVLALSEARALVVGVGALGAEIGRQLAVFGAEVVGTDARRDGPPEGFAELWHAEAMDALLPGADLVVVTVPHTPRTEGMFDAARFARCKPGAFFVNVGRGPVVDLGALTAALDDGPLRGAALDVFAEEPLPAGDPLWARHDVLITPHVAGVGPHAAERRYAVLRENAARFVAGRDLVNVVDKTQGA
ncbi:D-2-hydroxyacid dehydrogenase [Actinomadura flavalba]|uniref:D-2-hydroxyacid dehydrogenase n=1 Tax=Actinomadura flavalba TaxID=1120938 RepID=UPI00037EE96B|nr:D-2-hydroxyacid dehydrogenase [Actinomadura flavalba]